MHHITTFKTFYPNSHYNYKFNCANFISPNHVHSPASLNPELIPFFSYK